MPPARVPPELRSAPFCAKDAAKAGLSRDALRSGVWRRVFRDVFVLAELEDTPELRLAAARLALPDGVVVAGPTAAWLHGADVRAAGDLTVHLCVPPGRRPRPRAGVHVAETSLSTDDVIMLDGVAVTSPVRTAYDCARTRSRTRSCSRSSS